MKSMWLISILVLQTGFHLCFASDIAVLQSDQSNEEEEFSNDEVKAIQFLRRYGYLPEPTSRLPMSRPLFTNALNNYQVMSSISINSNLEDDTLSSMTSTRCGNADVRRSENSGLARYEIHAPRWNKGNLTWRISRYPVRPTSLTRSVVDGALRKAFRMWSNVSKIDFVQISGDSPRAADIDIRFKSSSYDDTCSIYFQDGELAHATLRRPAKIHFNGRVGWKIDLASRYNSDVDLVAVAAHEVGHVLGLDHSSDRNALMFARYQRQNSGLGRDDIQAIQFMYGERRNGASNDQGRPTTVTTCSKTFIRKMPNGDFICAVVYKEKLCRGQQLSIAHAYKTNELNEDWNDEISSVKVNPGCILNVCHRRRFQGGCTDLKGDKEGENYDLMPLGFDNLITSLACVCNHENRPRPESPVAPTESPEDDDIDDESIFQAGKEPPMFIPTTDRIRTCAVLAAGFEPGATRAWVENENATSMPLQLRGVSYIYLATRRDCSLLYCTEANFGGLCQVLPPKSHTKNTNEKFTIESLSCGCRRGF
jgi:hypothetical protein